MKLLYKRYGGLLARCPYCYALIGYDPDDVSTTQNIRCPQCQTVMWVPFNPNYDGLIRDNQVSEKKSDT